MSKPPAISSSGLSLQIESTSLGFPPILCDLTAIIPIMPQMWGLHILAIIPSFTPSTDETLQFLCKRRQELRYLGRLTFSHLLYIPPNQKIV